MSLDQGIQASRTQDLPRMTSSIKNRAEFPSPRSRNSPKTFKGKYDEVDPFLKEFDSLAKFYNLSTEERFDLLPRYVGTKVKRTLYGLSEFQTHKWDKLVIVLKKLYNHDRVEKAYKLHHLVLFTEGSSSGTINNLLDFHKYQRRFMRIAGWLLHKGNLTTTEHSRYFWKGMPKKTRDLLRNRIEIVNPQIDSSKPYEMSDIETAAEHVFNMSRFDDESSADEATVSEDSGSDASDDEDSEEETSRYKNKKKKTLTKKVKTQDRNVSPPAKALPKINGKSTTPSKQEEDEVAELIDRLSKMNMNDPGYAALYYRVTTRAPHMVPFLQTNTFRSNNNSNSNPSQGRAPTSTQNGPFECYFCGGQGHTTRRCQQADALIQQGTIARNAEGRLTWPDGSNILRKGGDEKLIEAINRELAFRAGVNKDRPATVNLIT
ncbi:MAG TPA: hypothetical protein VGO47_05095, partial [Chlamydiales bacterium]|nr:hypothetical protein [Chlamydiales bacterium]